MRIRGFDEKELDREIQIWKKFIDAVKCGDEEIVEQCLRCEKDNVIGSSCRAGSALHLAVKQANRGVLELLLNAGADVDMLIDRIPGEVTPLYLAAEKNDLESAKLLLEHGANPMKVVTIEAAQITGDDGYVFYKTRPTSPLEFALENGHDDMAQLMLRIGRKLINDGMRDLRAEIRSGNAQSFLERFEDGHHKLFSKSASKKRTHHSTHDGDHKSSHKKRYA